MLHFDTQRYITKRAKKTRQRGNNTERIITPIDGDNKFSLDYLKRVA